MAEVNKNSTSYTSVVSPQKKKEEKERKENKERVWGQTSDVIVLSFFFSDFLYKSICCGYSFELHGQVDAIQMGVHNICLYKKRRQKLHWL